MLYISFTYFLISHYWCHKTGRQWIYFIWYIMDFLLLYDYTWFTTLQERGKCKNSIVTYWEGALLKITYRPQMWNLKLK